MIVVKCPRCQSTLGVEDSWAGLTAFCMGCDAQLRIPDPRLRAGAPVGPLRIRCPGCKSRLTLDGSTAGTAQPCTGCGALLRIPYPKGRGPDETVSDAGDSRAAPSAAPNKSRPANTIRMRCPRCESRIEVAGNRAGDAEPCFGCGALLRVPQPPPSKARRFRIRCPKCTEKLEVSVASVGDVETCRGCGSYLRIPDPQSAGAMNVVPVEDDDDPGPYAVVLEEPPTLERRRIARRIELDALEVERLEGDGGARFLRTLQKVFVDTIIMMGMFFLVVVTVLTLSWFSLAVGFWASFLLGLILYWIGIIACGYIIFDERGVLYLLVVVTPAFAGLFCGTFAYIYPDMFYLTYISVFTVPMTLLLSLFLSFESAYKGALTYFFGVVLLVIAGVLLTLYQLSDQKKQDAPQRGVAAAPADPGSIPAASCAITIPRTVPTQTL